MKRKDY
jgi:hypothetical protein